METRPKVWIEALRRSHDRLQRVASPLGGDVLRRPSYASPWTVAEVLSHLGSQAEIFGLFLDAGLRGDEPPGREVFPSIWEAWNARSPERQQQDALAADERTLERFEALTDDELERLRLHVFGRDVDAAGLAQMRLSEHAIHTWDVEVALDPVATVAADAVSLLVDTLGQLAGRTGRSDGAERQVTVVTVDPERHFRLETGDAVTITDSASDGGRPRLRLPAEAFLRLVYGRLDADHTPALEADGVDLDELRGLFPGF